MWHPKSSLPGILWPAVPEREAATLLALQFQLSQTERWPPEQLRRAQLEQLAPLVHHARATTKHYSRSLADASAALPAGAPQTDELLRSLPLLLRRDIQLAGKDLFSSKYPSPHGPAKSVMTSGSTGQPVTVMQPGISGLLWLAFTLRDHIWHKRDLSAHLGVIKYLSDSAIGCPPDGTQLAGWGPATDAIFAPAPATLLSVGTPVDEQASWLQKTAPTYLLTHPSNLDALARHFAAYSLTPPSSLRQLRTLGEMLSGETRQLCREVFGLVVADMYSTQEVGYIALQCPDREHYHVQSEGVLVEVLDEAGEPCAPGQVGRVVVTDLHNYASPILRYVVGDYAEVGEPCSCGRGLPVLRRIVGRERGMWVRPDGRRAWPLITSKKMRTAAPYVQLQLVQLRIDLIRVRVVPEGTFEPAHERALSAAIHECLGYPTALDFEIVGSIERSAGGKFEEFICRVDAEDG